VCDRGPRRRNEWQHKMESNAYPFTTKTYPIDQISTIDISRLLWARNGQVSATVDRLDPLKPLCNARGVRSLLKVPAC
jgi:hypothetical protein